MSGSAGDGHWLRQVPLGKGYLSRSNRRNAAVRK